MKCIRYKRLPALTKDIKNKIRHIGSDNNNIYTHNGNKSNPIRSTYYCSHIYLMEHSWQNKFGLMANETFP